jgi:hypothetical protein
MLTLASGGIVRTKLSSRLAASATSSELSGPTGNATIGDTSSSKGLSAQAGIGIGVTVFVIVLAALAIFIFRKMGLTPTSAFKNRIKKKKDDDLTFESIDAGVSPSTTRKPTIVAVSSTHVPDAPQYASYSVSDRAGYPVEHDNAGYYDQNYYSSRTTGAPAASGYGANAQYYDQYAANEEYANGPAFVYSTKPNYTHTSQN